MRPTPVEAPQYATFAVPFAWMTRRDQEEIANRLPNRLPEDREPPFPTAWVFGRQRQEALLTTFFQALTPSKSLVFFYTKEGQPISDAINRLVVGVGRLTKVGSLLEYDSVGTKPVYPMWDRLVHHSIRPDGSDGSFCPTTRTSRQPVIPSKRAATGSPPRDRSRARARAHTGVLVLLGTCLGRCRPLYIGSLPRFGPAHSRPRYRRGAVGTPRRMAERADRPGVGGPRRLSRIGCGT